MTQRTLGSITQVGNDDLGAHVLTGSHCGSLTGDYALQAGLGSLIAHDAGVGLDEAGVAALRMLDLHDIPAAAVAHSSARIGDARDMLERGIVGHSNEAAIALGVVPGMQVDIAFARFKQSIVSSTSVRGAKEPVERRFVMRTATHPHDTAVILVDSAALVQADDIGAIVVTGSHGGLPGGSRSAALRAHAKLAVFNDAGVGVDEAGIGRLAVLQERGIPAMTVDCWSARIGDSRSTFETGVISHANGLARELGANPGQLAKTLIRELSELA